MLTALLALFFFAGPETPSPPQRAKHLSLATSATAASARPSLKLELIVEITMDPRFHVYAPSVEGYIPLTWAIADSTAWRSSTVQFPQSKNLQFKEIHETAPVFDGKFRLTREIVIADENTVRPLLDAAGNLVIEGVVKYQACDDKQCFLPVNVPVKWTLPFNKT